MNLVELFQGMDVDVIGDSQTVVNGICSFSFGVHQNDMFVVKKGKTYDGKSFAADAVKRGAVAVLTHSFVDSIGDIPQVIYKDWSKTIGEVTNKFYSSPSQQLYFVAVTGTNGKTTTTSIIRELLVNCGIIGTLGVVTDLDGRIKYSNTKLVSYTTYPIDLTQKYLKEMVDNGCQSVAIEASSQGLDQGRIKGLKIDVGVFLNLTQDHLDYHGTFEHYLKSKQILFDYVNDCEKIVVINADDRYSKIMIQNCRARTVSFGIRNSADYQATDIKLSMTETQFTLCSKGCMDEITIPLLGTHNVYNVLAAIAVAQSKGITLDVIKDKLAHVNQISGRLQKIPNELGLYIFVDFAHTPDALNVVLTFMTQVKSISQQVITVFGCGGNRDRSKRPKMANVVESLSDVVIVTSDNNRNEDFTQILADISSGITYRDKFFKEENRKVAIKTGIEKARTGDILLIAGRGHQRYMKVKDEMIPFHDATIVSEILEEMKCKR